MMVGSFCGSSGGLGIGAGGSEILVGFFCGYKRGMSSDVWGGRILLDGNGGKSLGANQVAVLAGNVCFSCPQTKVLGGAGAPEVRCCFCTQVVLDSRACLI